MLSWACTVHNVQVLSLNSVIITFDLERQISFIQAQMHIALRRVRDIKNFHLIGVYNCNAFHVNSYTNVTVEYNRL